MIMVAREYCHSDRFSITLTCQSIENEMQPGLFAGKSINTPNNSSATATMQTCTTAIQYLM